MKTIAKAILFSFAITACLTSFAGPRKTSFGIIADEKTYKECQAELEAYRDVLISEGLQARIVARNWQNPDEVKSAILDLASDRKCPLEGIVLVGDVPIVMVRGGQHLTTAFKMNEATFPPEESSVASDRFYDDFDLKFDYIGKDTTCAGRFFYRLSEDGAQHLRPDIYSARMKVPAVMLKGQDADMKYSLMKKYLIKVVETHKATEYLDRISFYFGDSYNSDDLNIWRQKAVEYKEFFPYAFRKSSGNTFMTHFQDPEMKWTLFSELQRKGTDIFQFSEHGAPETQYINWQNYSIDVNANLFTVKQMLAREYKRVKGTEDEEAFLHEALDSIFHLNRSVLSDSSLAALAAADSIKERNANISQEEMMNVRSNPKFVIFNACYNGSFHNPEGYVAGVHVFGDGDCVVAQGNTVNVLQDKLEDKMMGMLSIGIRIGQWHKEVPYLEAHLIGDPTYRFTPHDKAEAQLRDRLSYDLTNNALNEKTWQNYLKEGRRNDNYLERGLGIVHLGYAALEGSRNSASISDEALNVLRNDNSWSVRAAALDVLRSLADGNASEAILTALNDPFELVVRDACLFGAEYGSGDEILSSLRNIKSSHPELARVQMQAEDAIQIIDGFEYFDNDIKTLSDKSASSMKRMFAIRTFRNNRYQKAIDPLLDLVKDSDSPEDLRIAAAETLGWYNRSSARGAIRNDLNEFLGQSDCQGNLRKETAKTVKRLSY